jgi:hypothetical protein
MNNSLASAKHVAKRAASVIFLIWKLEASVQKSGVERVARSAG